VVLPEQVGREALLRWVGIAAAVTLVLSLVLPLLGRRRSTEETR
jgi:hypothetical protein